MEQYSFEPFESPSVNDKFHRLLNQFFAAKYGLFSCYSSNKIFVFGQPDFNSTLIEYHEKPKNLKRTWNLAILTAFLGSGRDYDALISHRIPY